jgi:hypothetical protein
MRLWRQWRARQPRGCLHSSHSHAPRVPAAARWLGADRLVPCAARGDGAEEADGSWRGWLARTGRCALARGAPRQAAARARSSRSTPAAPAPTMCAGSLRPLTTPLRWTTAPQKSRRTLNTSFGGRR